MDQDKDGSLNATELEAEAAMAQAHGFALAQIEEDVEDALF